MEEGERGRECYSVGKCLSLCVFGEKREVVIPNNVHTGGGGGGEYSYVHLYNKNIVLSIASLLGG